MEQLSLLDLLEPEPTPEPPVKQSLSQWCEACGEVEFMQQLMPGETKRFGHPVCLGMNLTLNHIHYSMGQTNTHDLRDPYPCCHDKHGIHGKKISKPTREHWLDHVRVDIERAQAKWKLHPISLMHAVEQMRGKHGITPAEAPIITKAHFNT